MADTTANQISAFKDVQRKLCRNYYLMSVVEFDGETMAPAKGAAARADAMGELAAERHELLTNGAARELVAALTEAQAAGELDQQTADELRVFARDQREATAIPAEEEAAWARLTAESTNAWRAAKVADDWASFEPYLTHVVEGVKRRAAYLDSTRDPYDVMLDQFERGMNAAAYDAFFAQVKDAVVPVVHEIASRPEEPKPAFATAYVPAAAQLAQARDLLALEGLDMDGLALAEVEHPFSNGVAPGDVRVTTHIYEHDALNSAFSVLHEGGHAIYEQNVDPAYAYTCLGCGTSSGVHESQSRFFENYIGRSRAFMGQLLSIMRAHAPEAFATATEDDLYRVVNHAKPGLIRMDADELTYPLHIMIRYDIERMLFTGEARVSEIPALWNKLTREYLGLEVPDNAHGCLQDTHWSDGSFGYFPAYALGSAYGAQFLDAMARADVDVEGACTSGDLAPVRAWLREHVWRRGSSVDGAQLVRDACGASFDASYYCRYLVNKFS